MQIATRPTTAPLLDLERDGYAVLPGAVDADTVAELAQAVDGVWQRRRIGPPRAGVAPLHLLAFLGEDDRFLQLVDRRPVLDVLVDALGDNIFLYHCHLDVHPPVTEPTRSWMWHQDGGIQNRDLETHPRPRLSLKVAYFLSDASEPDRGNFVVLPGSHHRDAVHRPADGSNDVPGATPILAAAGDAVIFDRRLWHMRSDNRSTVTRRAVFLAYTYRWIRPRDELPLPDTMVAAMSPAQRQLVGLDLEDPVRAWMPDHDPPPLRTALAR